MSNVQQLKVEGEKPKTTKDVLSVQQIQATEERKELQQKFLNSQGTRDKPINGVKCWQYTPRNVASMQDLPFSYREDPNASNKFVTSPVASGMTRSKAHSLGYIYGPLMRHSLSANTSIRDVINGSMPDVDISFQRYNKPTNFRKVASKHKGCEQVADPIEDTGGTIIPTSEPALYSKRKHQVDEEIFKELYEKYPDSNSIQGNHIPELFVLQSVTPYDVQSIAGKILKDNDDLANMLRSEMLAISNKPGTVLNENIITNIATSMPQSRKKSKDIKTQKKKKHQKNIIGMRSNLKKESTALRTTLINSKTTMSKDLHIASKSHNLEVRHSTVYAPERYSTNLANQQEHLFIHSNNDATFLLDSTGEILLLEINKIKGLQVLNSNQIRKLRQLVLKEHDFFENIYKINKNLLLLLLNPFTLAEELQALCDDKQRKFEMVLKRLELNIDTLKKLVGSSFDDYKRKYLTDSEMVLIEEAGKLCAGEFKGNELKYQEKDNESKHGIQEVKTLAPPLCGMGEDRPVHCDTNKRYESILNKSNGDYNAHLLCYNSNLDEQLKRLEAQEQDIRVKKLSPPRTTCDVGSKDIPSYLSSGDYMSELNKEVRRFLQTSTAHTHSYSIDRETTAEHLYHNDEYIRSLNYSLKRHNSMLFLLHLQQSKYQHASNAPGYNLAVENNGMISADVEDVFNEALSPPPPAPPDTQTGTFYKIERASAPPMNTLNQFTEHKKSQLQHQVGSPNYSISDRALYSMSTSKSLDACVNGKRGCKIDICNKFQGEYQDINMDMESLMSQSFGSYATNTSAHLCSNIRDVGTAEVSVTSAYSVSVELNKKLGHKYLNAAQLQQQILDQPGQSIEKGCILGEENLNYIIELSKNMPICSVYENKSIFNILIDDDIRIADEPFAWDSDPSHQQNGKFQHNQAIVAGIPPRYNRGIPDLLRTPVHAVSFTIGKIASTNYIADANIDIGELNKAESLNNYFTDQVEYYPISKDYNTRITFDCFEKDAERYKRLTDRIDTTASKQELFFNRALDGRNIKHNLNDGLSACDQAYSNILKKLNHFLPDNVKIKNSPGYGNSNSLTTTCVEYEIPCNGIQNYGKRKNRSSALTEAYTTNLTRTTSVNSVANSRASNFKLVLPKGHERRSKFLMNMNNFILKAENHGEQNYVNCENNGEGEEACSVSGTRSELRNLIPSDEPMDSVGYKTHLYLKKYNDKLIETYQQKRHAGQEEEGNEEVYVKGVSYQSDTNAVEENEILKMEHEVDAIATNVVQQMPKLKGQEKKFPRTQYSTENTTNKTLLERSASVSNLLPVINDPSRQQQCDHRVGYLSCTLKVRNEDGTGNLNINEKFTIKPKRNSSETVACFKDKEKIDGDEKNAVESNKWEISKAAKNITQDGNFLITPMNKYDGNVDSDNTSSKKNKQNGHSSGYAYHSLTKKPVDLTHDEDDSLHSFRTLLPSRNQSTEDSIDTDDEYFCYELRQLEALEKQRSAYTETKVTVANNTLTASPSENTHLNFTEVCNTQDHDVLTVSQSLFINNDFGPDEAIKELMTEVLRELKHFVNKLPAIDDTMPHTEINIFEKRQSSPKIFGNGLEHMTKVTDMHRAWQDCNGEDCKLGEYFNEDSLNSADRREVMCEDKIVCTIDSYDDLALQEVQYFGSQKGFVPSQSHFHKIRDPNSINTGTPQNKMIAHELRYSSNSPYSRAEEGTTFKNCNKKISKSSGQGSGCIEEQKHIFSIPIPAASKSHVEFHKDEQEIYGEGEKDKSMIVISQPIPVPDTSVGLSADAEGDKKQYIYNTDYEEYESCDSENKEIWKSIGKCYANLNQPFGKHIKKLPANVESVHRVEAKQSDVSNTIFSNGFTDGSTKTQTTIDNPAALGSSKWKLLKTLKERKIEEKNNQHKNKDDELSKERDKDFNMAHTNYELKFWS